jgi:hypothetical protein
MDQIHRHCEGRSPAAIQMALRMAPALRVAELLHGLPRRCVPRNDGLGCHCEGRRPAAIHTTGENCHSVPGRGPPCGLPRRYAPRNDGGGRDCRGASSGHDESSPSLRGPKSRGNPYGTGIATTFRESGPPHGWLRRCASRHDESCSFVKPTLRGDYEQVLTELRLVATIAQDFGVMDAGRVRVVFVLRRQRFVPLPVGLERSSRIPCCRERRPMSLRGRERSCALHRP